MAKLKIVEKNINDIIPYINNPRKNTDAVDKVASSIKNFGFKVPIIIDSDNEIIAGHTRVLAAKKLKMDTVPCIIADDLTDAQIKAFRIADNKVSEYSEWDYDLLSTELEELEEFDFDLESTGFDLDEIGIIMSDESNNEIVEDDFDVDGVLSDEPYSKRGDIWLLGKHRVMCGDSTTDDVDVLMDERKCDLILTDPPYNVAVNDESIKSLKARNRRTDGLKITNDKMSGEDFSIFLLSAFQKCYKILKDGGSIYIFYADSEVINFVSKYKEAGFHFAQNCIWNKQQFVMTRKDYHYKHEPIIYGWKKGVAHSWYTDRKQASVWNFDRPFKNEFHPTMKPIELLAYPIGNSSKQEDIVYDGFGGSGSTLIASEQLNRICYMMELDEKYVDVIVRRYSKFTNRDDIYLIRDGKKIKIVISDLFGGV